MAKSKPMTKSSAARIQSNTCKKNGGKTPKNSFAARAQRAADKKSWKTYSPARESFFIKRIIFFHMQYTFQAIINFLYEFLVN